MFERNQQGDCKTFIRYFYEVHKKIVRSSLEVCKVFERSL